MQINIEFSDLLSFLGQLLSSVLGLAGVMVGARIANQAAIEQRRLDSLRSAYADVYKRYIEGVPFKNVSQKAMLLSAIYSARLLSPPEIDKNLGLLADAVIKSEPDPTVCHKYLNEFWEGAQKEIRKGYGK